MRKPDIKARYQWLLDLLEAEFPGKVRDKVSGYGHAFAVGLVTKRGGHAVRVEYSWPEGGRLVPCPSEDDPDDTALVGATMRHYSLNDDPAKDAKVAKIIAAFRKAANA